VLLFGKHTWRGESGRAYVFHCALTKHGIPADSGGIYMFIKRYFGFYLHVLYVGKAANLRSRLLGHEKWGKAWWILGATERYTMRVKTEDERVMIEEDLIRGLKPKMNDIQMPRGENDAPNTAQLRRKWEWRRKVWNAISSLWGGKAKPVPEHHAHHGRKHGPADHGYWSRSSHA
jgi:hypothetical protein